MQFKIINYSQSRLPENPKPEIDEIRRNPLEEEDVDCVINFIVGQLAVWVPQALRERILPLYGLKRIN